MMNVENFLNQYNIERESRLDLSGINLSKVDMTYLDLSTVFRGSDLSEAILESVELNGANFAHSDLSGALCECANLSGADFRHADLSNARFGSATLERACLDGANLTNAYFVQASLKGASLRNTILTGATFEVCNLHRADFRGAVDANLTYGRLSYSILPDGTVITEECTVTGKSTGAVRKYFFPKRSSQDSNKA